VGLYRDSELDAGRPLSRTFEELIRRHLAVRMPLRRLPVESVAEMLHSLAGQQPPARLVEAIYTETEGNPFFTEEVFKHLAEEGRLFDADGRFRTDLTAEDLDVPEGVRMVIGARLRRLGEDGTRTLGAAAVLGRVFAFELLQHVEEIGEDPLLDVIEAAERTGLIKAVDAEGGEDRFIFAHELIRQTVLAELSAPRRRRLHLRAAEALERVHGSTLEPQAAAIANHLLQAGGAADRKRTFHYLCLAGRWALETAAFEEALTHLEAAASRIDAATPGERADLLSRLGTARRTNGQWIEAIETWKEAVDAYETLGDAEAAGRISADAAYSLAWASRWEEGMAIAQRGIDLLGDRVSATRARLLAMQGFVMGYAGVPFEVGDSLLSQALAVTDKLGDPALRGSCLLGKSLNRLAWMHRREVAEAGLEAAELLRAAGSRWEESAVLGFAGQGLVGGGRFEDARNLETYLEPLAERLGNVPALLMSGRVKHGMVEYAETGDLDALEAFGWRDLKLASDNGLPWVSHSHSWLGLAFFFKGEWDKARHHFETAAELEPAGNLHGQDQSLLFEFRAYAGERAAALAMLERADNDPMPVPGRPNGWGPWSMLLAAVEGLCLLGERDRAASYYDLVLECIERTQTTCAGFHDSRLPQRTAGIAATAARRFDDAERHFRTALRQAAELPHRPEEAAGTPGCSSNATAPATGPRLPKSPARPPTSTGGWACPATSSWLLASSTLRNSGAASCRRRRADGSATPNA
jgi:tetratricopeptide (TPR) repeat protein